jgi:hypothetical protein
MPSFPLRGREGEGSFLQYHCFFVSVHRLKKRENIKANLSTEYLPRALRHLSVSLLSDLSPRQPKRKKPFENAHTSRLPVSTFLPACSLLELPSVLVTLGRLPWSVGHCGSGVVAAEEGKRKGRSKGMAGKRDRVKGGGKDARCSRQQPSSRRLWWKGKGRNAQG